MENQRGPLLSWAYFCHGKNQTMDELKNSLLYTTLELESTRLAAQDELRKRDDQLAHIKELLGRAMRERDEAHEKYQKLLLDKLLLQQQQSLNALGKATQPPLSGVSSIEDEPRRGIESANNGFSSSDCEESIVSSPASGALPRLQQELDSILPEKPLPEKGKLLQAVMKAGPLLQTLLLAGPLPQWRHPPPPLESFEIPPVSIPSPPPPTLLLPDSIVAANCGRLTRKRGISDGSESPTDTKFQRVCLN